MIFLSVLVVVVGAFLTIMEINFAISSFPSEGNEEVLVAVEPATDRLSSASTFAFIGFGTGVPIFVGGLVLFLSGRNRS